MHGLSPLQKGMVPCRKEARKDGKGPSLSGGVISFTLSAPVSFYSLPAFFRSLTTFGAWSLVASMAAAAFSIADRTGSRSRRA